MSSYPSSRWRSILLVKSRGPSTIIQLTVDTAAINTTNALCGIPIKDRSNQLIITNAVFGALALLALLIRLQVSIQQHIFGLDDFSAVVAYTFSAPVTFGQLVCGVFGFGKDTWAVPPENIYLIMKVRSAESIKSYDVT